MQDWPGIRIIAPYRSCWANLKFTEEFPDGSYVINSYSENRIVINSVAYTVSLVITPHALITDWPPASMSELKGAHFEAMLEYDPEVIILGTGLKLVFPNPDITAAVINRNIGLEIMDTGAACRTNEVLASENRIVVAGLIIG